MIMNTHIRIDSRFPPPSDDVLSLHGGDPEAAKRYHTLATQGLGRFCDLYPHIIDDVTTLAVKEELFRAKLAKEFNGHNAPLPLAEVVLLPAREDVQPTQTRQIS